MEDWGRFRRLHAHAEKQQSVKSTKGDMGIVGRMAGPVDNTGKRMSNMSAKSKWNQRPK